VTGYNAHPTTVPGVYRAAARLLVKNGHHQGDYLPDPFDRVSKTPHASRPLSIGFALRCVVAGNPHQESTLAEAAIRILAERLVVNDELGPYWKDFGSVESHVSAWGDVEGRTVESVVAVLEAAADATDGLTAADLLAVTDLIDPTGGAWRRAEGHWRRGDPLYVLDGVDAGSCADLVMSTERELSVLFGGPLAHRSVAA
jgi:hypothetical protein